MTPEEFSSEFDARFNYVNSNLAWSINDYEKSIYLTHAQEEIISNYFNPKGNKYGEGYDMSEKRQIDFSSITNSSSITSEESGQTPFSDYGLVFKIADDVLFILNERFNYKKADDSDVKTSVFPLEYKDFQRILSKSYQSPPSRQSWRLIKGGTTAGNVIVEILPKKNIDKSKAFQYSVRYIKRPTPIVVADLPSPLTVNSIAVKTACILPPEIHNEILDRAIELAKIDYTGDTGALLQINQRSE